MPGENEELQQITPEDEELIQMMASLKAEHAAGALKGTFEGYIHRIEGLGSNRKGQIGKVLTTCSNGEDYCQGTYTQACKDVFAQNDLPFGILTGSRTDKNGDPRGEVWTNGALQWFDKNSNPEFKKCGQSIKDFPFKKSPHNLKEMILEGYNNGEDPCTIPVGSLILAQRTDENGNPKMHAMMFTGINPQTKLPMFSYANKERIDVSFSNWLNQTAQGNRKRGNDVYVINIPQAISVMAMEAEREKFLQMGKEAYIASYQNMSGENGNLQYLADAMDNYMMQNPVNQPEIMDPMKNPEQQNFAQAPVPEVPPLPSVGAKIAEIYGVGLAQKGPEGPVDPVKAAQDIHASAALLALSLSNSKVAEATMAAAQKIKENADKQEAGRTTQDIKAINAQRGGSRS